MNGITIASSRENSVIYSIDVALRPFDTIILKFACFFVEMLLFVAIVMGQAVKN